MSAQASVRLFESIVSALNRAASGPPDAAFSHSDAVGALLHTVRQQPVMPRTVWKKLQQLSVPKLICRACAQLIQLPVPLQTVVAVDALQALLLALKASGLDSGTAPSTSTSSRSSGTSSSKQLVQEQLSELLPALPKLAAKVAAQLNASAATTAQPPRIQGPAQVVLLLAVENLAVNTFTVLTYLPQFLPGCLTSTAHGDPIPLAGLLTATLGYLQGCIQAEREGFRPSSTQEMLLQGVEFLANNVLGITAAP